ncbi:MAG: 3-isopropylmalate dehydratase [Nitrososphaerota archaeon]|nr:3-isopropylmalate dehydratase [Nitrososphaerota archaeon]
MELRGKVAKKYGDDINTDYIIPAYLLQESWDKQFFADHAFEYYDPSFKTACRTNKESIVVATNNFGCGSSREQAVYAVKYNNVVAVVAQSFPDIFYRNCLNNGLLPIQVEDTSKIGEGDELLIDLDGRSLKNLTKGGQYAIIATDSAIDQMKKGGFMGFVRERLRTRLASAT